MSTPIDRVKIMQAEILSDNWYTLKKVTFAYLRADGQWETQQREAYDRGNGAVILLYDPARKKVLLTRQFRLPTYLNGNSDGQMIEACAGLLDEDEPEECIRRETEEETGYRVDKVRKIFQAYTSPGSVTEILHFFVGEYDPSMQVSAGGGLATEHENIEVLEMDFATALAMVYDGRIQDVKTILLLQYAQMHSLV